MIWKKTAGSRKEEQENAAEWNWHKSSQIEWCTIFNEAVIEKESESDQTEWSKRGRDCC